ncbi:MAG: HEAT repeat domain-containing protein [Bacteroidota bacterium]
MLGILYFVFVFFFRNKLSRLALRTKNKREELAPIISNFLFHSPEDSKAEQKEYVELKIEIREYLGDTQFRKIISQILFDLQKDVAGATRERLFKLYKELELHHDAFQKLESWRWETIAQGILELSQMEVEESHQLIRKFINDRRSVIRKQAELATVSLRWDGIDYLLDTTRHSISEWQQLKLIETLGKRRNYRPPPFKGWLLSQNKDVVLFALRLIKHYNQKGAEPSINELVKHKNDEVRIAAIQCIVDFDFQSALPVLKKVFSNSTNTVKLSILTAISALGSNGDIAFLKEVAKKESSFIVVGKAQSTINAIAPETILPSKDIIDLGGEGDRGTPQNPEETILNKEVEATPVLDIIEVEDIEFYDEVEVPEPDSPKETDTPFDPAFELHPLEREHGSAMDQLLGLVSSSEEDFDSSDLTATYDKISYSEKSKLVNQLSTNTDGRELHLLEHIATNEPDSELRFHAFKKLKAIREQVNDSRDTLSTEGFHLPLEQQSIFYPLYHYTDEVDAKLILLDELMTLGDRRDVPFLESVLSEKESTIVRKAKEAITFFNEKVENPEPRSDDGKENNPNENPTATKEMEHKIPFEKDERIPMELFLLYEELGIESASEREKEPSPFDFELSQEFFLEMDNDLTTHQIGRNE